MAKKEFNYILLLLLLVGLSLLSTQNNRLIPNKIEVFSYLQATGGNGDDVANGDGNGDGSASEGQDTPSGRAESKEFRGKLSETTPALQIVYISLEDLQFFKQHLEGHQVDGILISIDISKTEIYPKTDFDETSPALEFGEEIIEPKETQETLIEEIQNDPTEYTQEELKLVADSLSEGIKMPITKDIVVNKITEAYFLNLVKNPVRDIDIDGNILYDQKAIQLYLKDKTGETKATLKISPSTRTYQIKFN